MRHEKAYRVVVAFGLPIQCFVRHASKRRLEIVASMVELRQLGLAVNDALSYDRPYSLPFLVR